MVHTYRRQAWIMPLMSWPAKACLADQVERSCRVRDHHAAGIREPATPSRRWGDAQSRHIEFFVTPIKTNAAPLPVSWKDRQPTRCNRPRRSSFGGSHCSRSRM